jgi:hypothetical protein
MRLFGMRGRS